MLPTVPAAPDVDLTAASDAQVVEFIENEVVAPVQLASHLTRHLDRWRSLEEPLKSAGTLRTEGKTTLKHVGA